MVPTLVVMTRLLPLLTIAVMSLYTILLGQSQQKNGEIALRADVSASRDLSTLLHMMVRRFLVDIFRIWAV